MEGKKSLNDLILGRDIMFFLPQVEPNPHLTAGFWRMNLFPNIIPAPQTTGQDAVQDEPQQSATETEERDCLDGS